MRDLFVLSCAPGPHRQRPPPPPPRRHRQPLALMGPLPRPRLRPRIPHGRGRRAAPQGAESTLVGRIREEPGGHGEVSHGVTSRAPATSPSITPSHPRGRSVAVGRRSLPHGGASGYRRTDDEDGVAWAAG